MSNTWMVYAGSAIGVAAMVGAAIYGTAYQQSFVRDDAVLILATKQGSFSPESGLGLS